MVKQDQLNEVLLTATLGYSLEIQLATEIQLITKVCSSDWPLIGANDLEQDQQNLVGHFPFEIAFKEQGKNGIKELSFVQVFDLSIKGMEEC